MGLGIGFAEKGLLPDSVIRWGIRRLAADRLREQQALWADEAALNRFLEQAGRSPLAPSPEKANEQHYEVPAEFYKLVLGKRLKYSSGYWPEGTNDLDSSEDAALEQTALRAALADGQDILELGCGWGSLTLWMAQRYPKSRILAVSNSRGQRVHIQSECVRLGLSNVEILTADVNGFDTERRFDRIVSVEMFEHVRNHRALFSSLQRWLKPGGALFLHIFCHEKFAYPFETDGDDDWMGRHFFTGGLMPSAGLLPACAGPLKLESSWRWSGEHYQRTANAWLARLDENRGQAAKVLRRGHGEDAALWVSRWRIFFMACAELFGYDEGKEWGVAHYLFRKDE